MYAHWHTQAGLTLHSQTTCPDTMIVMWALYRVAGIEGLALSALMFIILNSAFDHNPQ